MRQLFKNSKKILNKNNNLFNSNISLLLEKTTLNNLLNKKNKYHPDVKIYEELKTIQYMLKN
jgi:hypothetical protein